MERYFDSIHRLSDAAREETGKNRRFPVRFILTEGWIAWQETITAISLESDEILRLSEWCSGDDIFPYLDMLKIRSWVEKKGARQVLIVPLSECIRLNHQKYAEFLRQLAQWEWIGPRQMYVPLLDVSDIFYEQMEKTSRFTEGTLPDVWILRGTGSVQLKISPFPMNTPNFLEVQGIKPYLELWEKGGDACIHLTSGFAGYFTDQAGNFEIRVYKNGYELVRERVFDPEILKSEWAGSEQWEWLSGQIQENETIETCLKRLLNIQMVNHIQLLSLWNSSDDRRKWLIWLCGKLQIKDGSYFASALGTSHNYQQLFESLVNGVFDRKFEPDQLRERIALLKCFNPSELPDSFWEKLNKIHLPLERIRLFTGITVREKIEIISLLKQLMATRAGQDPWRPDIQRIFPEITHYLSISFEEDFLTEYFKLYVYSRVMDTPRDELFQMARQAAQEEWLWRFPTREKLMEQTKNPDFPVLWVDGMGLEWMGMMTGFFSQHPEIKVDIKIARSNLPSTTECNHHWKDEDEVVRGLDKTAHEYDYAFPESFIKSLDVMKDVGERVLHLFHQSGGVLITSDHGLTRFASHGEKIRIPAGGEPHKWGRYAAIKGTYDHDKTQNPFCITIDNNLFLAIHGRFEGGAGSSGEVHGGATLEECLVPVIILTRAKPLGELHIILAQPIIKLDVKGRGTLNVDVSENFGSLMLRVSDTVFKGKKTGVNKWEIPIEKLSPGSYHGRIECDGAVCGVEFNIVKGLIEKNLGL